MLVTAYSVAPSATHETACASAIYGIGPLVDETVLAPVLPDEAYKLTIMSQPLGLICTIDAPTVTGPTAGSIVEFDVACVASAVTTTYGGPTASAVDTPTPTTLYVEISDLGTVTDIDFQIELTDGNSYAREIEISLKPCDGGSARRRLR